MRSAAAERHDTTAMKTNFKSLILTFLAAAWLTLLVSGCKHTAHGVGQDVEKAGEKIQEKTK
jgi:predicted small secreted protein